MTNIVSIHPDHSGQQTTLKSLDSWVAELVLRVKALESEMKAKDEKITRLEKRLADAEKSKSMNWSNVVAGANKSPSVTAQNDTHKVINAVVANMNERKARENNLVIFGASVSTEASETDHDKRDFELINQVLSAVGIESNKMVKKHRLKSKPNNSKPPPIIVQLSSAEARQLALRNARQLRDIDKFKGVFIGPDLTLAERIEAKELRQKRNQLNRELEEKRGEKDGDQSKYHYVIRGNKLVKWYTKSSDSQQ